MKRFLAAGMLLSCLGFLVGCGGSDSNNTSANSTTPNSESTPTVVPTADTVEAMPAGDPVTQETTDENSQAPQKVEKEEADSAGGLELSPPDNSSKKNKSNTQVASRPKTVFGGAATAIFNGVKNSLPISFGQTSSEESEAPLAAATKESDPFPSGEPAEALEAFENNTTEEK